MWIETAHAIAPVYTALIALAFSAAIVLVMYLSAQESQMFVCETRRSMRLLDAIREQAAKLHERDTLKPPEPTGVVSLNSELEKQCWSDRFGVPPDALKAVVQRVGPMAPAIGRYLENVPPIIAATGPGARGRSPSASAARSR